MGRKYEVTGNAVIYTLDGVKVVDCEVRRKASVYGDSNDFHFDNKFRKQYGEKYILIGGARTVPTDDIFAKPAYHPETVIQAFNYSLSKFFRLTLRLSRLAQWEPLNCYNLVMNRLWFCTNHFTEYNKPDINLFGNIDAQLYRKYDFTPQMIHFAEKLS